MMLTQTTTQWLHSLGLDHAQVRDAVRALSPEDLATVVQAARSPFLGELVHTDQGGWPTTPLPISKSLAQSKCVFALTMNTGTYPRKHHWLTHLGWMVALQVQPGGGDWSMPPDAVDLHEALNRHQEQLTAEMRRQPTSTLGVMLYRTIHQLTLSTTGEDPEYWLFTRVCQSVLCGLIADRAQGSPLAEGGYDDAAAAMLRQAIITGEDDDAAFDLADRAQMPEAYEARRRSIHDSAPF
ncbi:hypothetical protein NE857_34085 (plasmid) [Nocardiopsis exhalans]|uniref:Uncharacterized protein n=1 Tax=Nocardiopsis exhalans TaxID=163604 RepID=A0ABY5DGU5_9ACTN|nr:hypothetical protein [Nocardiopsis exhalans]USY23564.1 hypothetical protein NE857_34085 [Nocardiopsis exhalans]